MSSANQKLNAFTVIHGENEADGMISQATYLTRYFLHHVAFADMAEKQMQDGEIPAYLLTKQTKAIVITGVLFPNHTQRIKRIVTQERFFIATPGNKHPESIARPYILITTCSPLEKIPLTMFPGTVGVLKCG